MNNNELNNVIVLRSVYGKVGQKYYIQPCKDKMGNYPPCVKYVDSHDDLILTEKERNSGKIFIKESAVFEVQDGTVFDLNDERQAAIWEAIKNCVLIAPERDAKDKNGNSLIDGTVGWNNKRPRYGIAELYVEQPGRDTEMRNNRKQKVANASMLIFNASEESQLNAARLLGKNMRNMNHNDVVDYLLNVAEKDPEKISNVFTGSDLELRILFCDAVDKGVITIKNKLYIYKDSIMLGGTDSAVLTWMKDAKNATLLNEIKAAVYPEFESAKTKSKSN